jgi:hypothetical protein
MCTNQQLLEGKTYFSLPHQWGNFMLPVVFEILTWMSPLARTWASVSPDYIYRHPGYRLM